MPVLSGDTDAFCPRPQIDETQGPKHAFDFSSHARSRFADSRFEIFVPAEPRLRFDPFSARATGPPAAPRASLSNEHAHVRFTMGATTSRCEEAEAEPVQEVRSAVRCLRLQVSISFLPVSFAVQAGTGKKEALDGRPNLPVPLPIFRLRSKSPLPRSRRSPPPTSRCAPAPRVNALSQNPAIEALPSPRFFSFPRLYPKALSPLCLTFVLPRLHVQIETAPFDPRFPQTNQAKHCYTRYNEFHKCVPLPRGPSTPRPQITMVVVGCQRTLL